MTIRDYRCADDHWTELVVSIHDPDSPPPCEECGRPTVRVYSMPAIAADATPNKKHGVRAIDAKEAGWSKDHDAYRRLRKDGLQPQHVDGSHRLEANAKSRTEIETGIKVSDEIAKAVS